MKKKKGKLIFAAKIDRASGKVKPTLGQVVHTAGPD